MMRRTSVLLPEFAFERLKQRARRRGKTVSEEIREAVETVLEEEGNPNQGLLDLAELFKDVAWKPGPSIDSDEFKQQMAKDIFRDAMNREPGW